MRNINFSGAMQMAKSMGAFSIEEVGDEQEIARDWVEKNASAYETWLPMLAELGLSGSKVSLERFISALRKDGSKWVDIRHSSAEFVGRLIDETKEKKFLALTPREADIFSNPIRGWDLAAGRFPETREDVEEASKCLALSRYPAAVFHSVQIIEVGLIELGCFLRVEDPHSGWTSVSSALKKVINKKHGERTQFERKNFHFLEQMEGLVHGLKNAWRNKISHANGKLILISSDFKPEIAEEILMATRAFMRRLAEELPPPKPKKTGKKK